jgi:hypothetical protein
MKHQRWRVGAFDFFQGRIEGGVMGVIVDFNLGKGVPTLEAVKRIAMQHPPLLKRNLVESV